MEFQIFKNPLWSFFYIFSVFIFMYHACIGWKKVDVGRKHSNLED